MQNKSGKFCGLLLIVILIFSGHALAEKKNKKNKNGGKNNPLASSAPRDVQKRSGLIPTGLKPIYPEEARCLEIHSFFGDRTRYDGSLRRLDANHGYHGGIDISADIGTDLIALADGEVIHKYTGGRLVGNQIYLRHAPEDTGLSVWIYSKYKHFDELPGLEIGDRVRKGDVLGPSGRTGTTGGHYGVRGYPHLHLSIYVSDSPEYRSRRSMVIPKNPRQLDPLALFLPLEDRITDSHAAAALPDDLKKVRITYLAENGEVVPEDARIIWPFRCLAVD